MASKCKKCDPHELCEECPEWIFTLADLIMCMMGLFVLLWVLKESGSKAATPQQAQQQQQEWVHGFEQGFSGYIPTPAPDDATKLRKLNGPGERGETNDDKPAVDGTESQTSIIRAGKETAVGGRLGFDKGAALLSSANKRALDGVAAQIRGHNQIVQIKGHASRDDLGLDGTAAKAMDLSLRRAQAVADYLASKGVQAEILRVQGCGAFEPVQQGNSAVDAQALNRRVEVFTTDTLVQQFQDQGPTARPVDTTDDRQSPQADAAH